MAGGGGPVWPLVPWTILMQVIFSLISIGYLWKKRATASKGDIEAARFVILPVFEPLLWTCLICQVLHFSLCVYSFPEMPRWRMRAKWEEVDVRWMDTLQYGVSMTAVNIEYNLIAALYMQTDLSYRSIWRSISYVLMYAEMVTLISTFCYHSNISRRAFATVDGLFFAFEALCYLFLLFRSAIVSRSTFYVYATYSIFWRLMIVPSTWTAELYFLWVACRSLAFSPCLYFTLWSETQYWRGNTKKSLWLLNRELGFVDAYDTSQDGLGASVISMDLPELLKENSLIDFAFLTFQELLDEGTHSKVYKGRYRGTQVAIKLFTPSVMDRAAMRRFIEETRIATRLEHPHIVKFYGVAVRPPDICMVVEFCELGSLYKALATKKLSMVEKLNLMIQAVSAVGHLHTRTPPVIHRDIKSHNFLVTQDWMLKLADFGESRLVDANMTGYIGSHAYMSPEIITMNPYNTKADVYSLGIVLWEILTQRRPYSGIKQMTILRNVVASSLRPDISRDVPARLNALLKAMWVSNPDSRPDAQEAMSVLLRFRKKWIQQKNRRQQLQRIRSNPDPPRRPHHSQSQSQSQSQSASRHSAIGRSMSYGYQYSETDESDYKHSARKRRSRRRPNAAAFHPAPALAPAPSLRRIEDEGGGNRRRWRRTMDSSSTLAKTASSLSLSLSLSGPRSGVGLDEKEKEWNSSGGHRNGAHHHPRDDENNGGYLSEMDGEEEYEHRERKRKGSGSAPKQGKRWLLQNLLAKELSEVERQLDQIAMRKMVITEQLALQKNAQLHSQPLTRSMSIGGYGSLKINPSRPNSDFLGLQNANTINFGEKYPRAWLSSVESAQSDRKHAILEDDADDCSTKLVHDDFVETDQKNGYDVHTPMLREV